MNQDDPAWLMLPLAHRQGALRRLKVMLQYDGHGCPGKQEAQDAAQRLGVTIGQFYSLRRQWLQNRSIMDLLPYGKPGATRKPKLDQDVSEAMNNLITEAIATGGARVPAEIVRRVQRGWTLEKTIPSQLTLRKNIAKALEKLANVSGGPVLGNAIIPQETPATATGYGEVVAIDHIGLKVFVASEGGPVVPTATFAIDLFASSISGFYLSFGAPGPFQFEAVLRDAETRSKYYAHPGMDAAKPRLVFNASSNPGWSDLIWRMEKAQHGVDVQRAQRLNFGDTVGALIGNSIGSINLANRRYMNETAFDPGRDDLISFGELKNIIEDGVRILNEKRIPAGIQTHPLKFDF